MAYQGMEIPELPTNIVFQMIERRFVFVGLKIDSQQWDLPSRNLIQNAPHFQIAESGRRHEDRSPKAPVAR